MDGILAASYWLLVTLGSTAEHSHQRQAAIQLWRAAADLDKLLRRVSPLASWRRSQDRHPKAALTGSHRFHQPASS
jgi:hypothetical protein